MMMTKIHLLPQQAEYLRYGVMGYSMQKAAEKAGFEAPVFTDTIVKVELPDGSPTTYVWMLPQVLESVEDDDRT